MGSHTNQSINRSDPHFPRVPPVRCCCLWLPVAACCCLLLPVAACCCLLLLPVAACCCLQSVPLLSCPVLLLDQAAKIKPVAGTVVMDAPDNWMELSESDLRSFASRQRPTHAPAPAAVSAAPPVPASAPAPAPAPVPRAVSDAAAAAGASASTAPVSEVASPGPRSTLSTAHKQALQSTVDALMQV